MVGPEVLVPDNAWPCSRFVGEGARPLLQSIYADGRPLSEQFDSLHCSSTQQHESAVLLELFVLILLLHITQVTSPLR